MVKIRKKDIRDKRFCQGETEDGKILHIVEMKDGTEHQLTTKEMKELNLIELRGRHTP